MKSIPTRLEKALRKGIVLFDYLFWLLLDPSKFVSIDKKKVKKILIIHLGAMGEILVSTPVIKALKEKFNARISYMVSSGKERILKNNPHVDEIITCQKKFKMVLEQIKSNNFDMAVIMWPCSLPMALMCYFAGIKYRIGGFKNIKEGPQFFLTRRMLDLRSNHVIENNLDIPRTIGADTKNPKMEFYIEDHEIKKISDFLKRNKIGKFAIIHPGFSFSSQTKYPSRWWPEKRYAQVADWIVKQKKMKVLITGNEDEKEFSNKIKESAKNKKKVIITNGLFNSIGELGALLGKSEVLIAPGTGVLHLSSALNKKMVALMGKENPAEWHPWTDKKNYKVLFHPEVCTECDKNYCRKRTQECMLAISSEEVINAANKLLK